jgi:hypothetical protein
MALLIYLRDCYSGSNASRFTVSPDKSFWNLNNLTDGPGVQYSTMIRCSGRKIDKQRENAAGRKCFSNLKAHIQNHQDLLYTEHIFKMCSMQRRADCTSTTTGTCFSIFADCEHQHVLEYRTRGMFALWNDCYWASYKRWRNSYKTLFSKQPTYIVWQYYQPTCLQEMRIKYKRGINSP